MKILLIIPPFTQLNTPYPATAYLKPLLDECGYETKQIDLGNRTIGEIFSAGGLEKIYRNLESRYPDSDYAALNRFFSLKDQYLGTIDPVVSFLQGKNESATYRINSENWLPEGERQEYDRKNSRNESEISHTDKARHKATLYLEEIGDIITAFCDESFGFSRYAERIALSPPRFDEIKEKLDFEPSFMTGIFTDILKEEIEKFEPDLCGFTVPFPGNLFSTLASSKFIRKEYPRIKTVMGGGYINTELRSLRDIRLFDYIDYITLDDGEAPLLSLCRFLNGTGEREQLKRVFLPDGRGNVSFINSDQVQEIPHSELPAPDYTGLMDEPYLSILPVTNRMHRLWSEGIWNKMTLAHGCYWHRCAFCDTSLDYIKRYETASAETTVGKIKGLIDKTGIRSFHFVDEAAPPALLKNMAIELIRQKISISWWTNIRFEKSFKPDLCRLLAKSGCIAVSGGLEVASDRLLNRIDKGVTVRQVSSVAAAFRTSGILVHTYLMYGFPGQSKKEIIDALENIRQLFEEGYIDSAFWHQFALTAHSPAGLNPEKFGITITGPDNVSFARNDLEFTDRSGFDPSDFSSGLKAALDSYMNGRGLNKPVNSWFNFKTPKTSVKKNYIRNLAGEMKNTLSIHDFSRFLWTGSEPAYRNGYIELHDIDGSEKIKAEKNMWNFLSELLKICNIKEHNKVTVLNAEELCSNYSIDFDSFLSSELLSVLSAYGLLIL